MKFNKINEWIPKEKPKSIPVLSMRQSVRTFSNENSFTKYYNANPGEFEGKTTQTLNKQFKIKGYTLAQIPDDEGIMQLHLCRVKLKPDWESFEELEARISVLEELLKSENKNNNFRGHIESCLTSERLEPTKTVDSKELSQCD